MRLVFTFFVYFAYHLSTFLIFLNLQASNPFQNEIQLIFHNPVASKLPY